MFSRRTVLQMIATLPFVGKLVPRPPTTNMTLGEWAKINTKRLGPNRIARLKLRHTAHKRQRKTKPISFLFHRKTNKWVGTIFKVPKK